MKIATIAVWLFVLFAAPPTADATSAARAAKDRLTAKETRIRTHICKELGDVFCKTLFADQRFAVDPAFFAPPAAKPRPSRISRPDYDYVFSAWSLATGKQFLGDNKDAFDYEEATLGIPREIVNAVLDIETQWGRVTGTRLVAVRLYTLAVARPNFIKPGWAENELIAFLKICEVKKIDPFSVKGSRTGAFGLAQFEPTSYATFATRCKADGNPPDLFADADAICSIGNYIRRAGWGKSETEQRKAIWNYNHDRYYVAAVLDYADLLMNKKNLRRYRFVHPPATE